MMHKTKKTLVLTAILPGLLLIAPLVLAQQEPKEPPKEEPKMVQFQMAIIKKGPSWTDAKSDAVTQIQQKHFQFVMSVINSGRAIIVGPMADDKGILGIFIFRAKSTEEAKAWVDEDPATKAGFHVAEIHPWWSEDIFKPANTPLKLETVYLGFLTKGANRKDGDDKNPEIQELQKAHLANIIRLAGLKKLVAAGPFGDNGALRGLFVFRVGSLREAEELTATDPMVKVHRLEVELHPWQVPEGMLP